MFFSLYLIDKEQRRVGKYGENGPEPYIICTKDRSTLQTQLYKLSGEYQLDAVDSRFYTLEDADIVVDNNRLILKSGLNLPVNFN